MLGKGQLKMLVIFMYSNVWKDFDEWWHANHPMTFDTFFLFVSCLICASFTGMFNHVRKTGRKPAFKLFVWYDAC